MLDGRCTADDGCPRAQGFYFRARVADGLPLARASAAASDAAAEAAAEIRLTVVPRADAREGANFSVATVVAEM